VAIVNTIRVQLQSSCSLIENVSHSCMRSARLAVYLVCALTDREVLFLPKRTKDCKGWVFTVECQSSVGNYSTGESQQGPLLLENLLLSAGWTNVGAEL
jgi:hypothetical protein